MHRLLLLFLSGCVFALSSTIGVASGVTCFPSALSQTTSYVVTSGSFSLLAGLQPKTPLDFAYLNVSDVSLVVQSDVSPPDLTLRLQQANGTSFVLWQKTFPSVPLHQSLSLIFANDGNLVLHTTTPGGVTTTVWATYTCASCGPAAALVFLFSAFYPYMQFYNSSCTVVWTPSGALQRPVSSPTAPTQGYVPFAAHASLPLSYYYRTLGVNTHFSQGYLSVPSNLQLLKYIGVSAIRDGLNVGALSSYRSVAAAGIRISLTIGGQSNMTVAMLAAQTIVTDPGIQNMVQSLEGFNEINNFPFAYAGYNASKTGTYRGMSLAMQDLYALLKGNSHLAKLPVFHLTGGTFSDGVAQNLTNIAGQADYYNGHPYPPSGLPLAAAATEGCTHALLSSYPKYWTPANPSVITEFGWSTTQTATFSNGVSLNKQALLMGSAVFDAIYDQVSQVFIYELHDEYFGNPADSTIYFGVFDHSLNAKPAAEILHRLAGLLEDPRDIGPTLERNGTFVTPLARPGPANRSLATSNDASVIYDGPQDATGPSLNYSITGLPTPAKRLDPIGGSPVRFLTLYSDTGASGWWVPVWWNQVAQDNDTIASTTATFQLGSGLVANLTVHDVYNGATAMQYAVTSCVRCTSITFQLANTVVLVNAQAWPFSGDSAQPASNASPSDSSDTSSCGSSSSASNDISAGEVIAVAFWQLVLLSILGIAVVRTA